MTLIGQSAFEECTSLTSITIADGVTTIGDNSFNYCTSLTSIYIPGSVTSIGNGAFAGCIGLASITIPDGLTSIADAAFYGCSSLTNVSIPESVTSIGSAAFEGCTRLTDILIPERVTSIGDRAFYSCENAGTCYFEGEAPTTIGTEVFNNIQTPYIIVGGSEAASFGGNGATFSGLIVVDYSKVATVANLYTQSVYDSVVAERDARLTESEVRDLRLGSSMLEVVDGDASINIELEATDNLGITNPTWTPVPESKVIIHPNYLNGKIKIDVEADDESNPGVRFYRFKL
ncbi:MAG: leucine-rich repeat domain-containing protein, partial [Verrucomicrobiota bacterium]|nr:leucine-rich repeat domain-containing protein [Verrucomicrobiota bacterium]